jgi:hypothetical protein
MKPKELEQRIAARQGRIADELILQYENLFHVLSVSSRRMSHKQWTSGPTPARTPVRQVCHITGSCDAYAAQDWGICREHFGRPVDWLNIETPADQLPKVKQVLEYVDAARQRLTRWLGAMSNEELCGPAPNPGWAQRGWTPLGHVIYVLRHATLHLGYLRAELNERGLEYGVFK